MADNATGSATPKAGDAAAGFGALITRAIEERTVAALSQVAPGEAPTAPLPFLMAPAFREIYGAILRNGVMPLILAARPIKALELAHDWSAVGGERFGEILAMPGNPIEDAWDQSWQALWATQDVIVGARVVDDESDRAAQASAERARRAPDAETGRRSRKGGLFGRLSKLFTEEVPPAEAAKDPSDRRRRLEGGESVSFRALIERHAETRGYHAPQDDDIHAIRELIRIKPATLERAWADISSLHMREFKPIGVQRAEKGALMDAMNRWQRELSPRFGEYMMIRAATDLEYCDSQFIRHLIRLCSDSLEAGERALPLLTEYQRSLPKVIR